MATIREMENRVLKARDSIETIMLRIIDEYRSDIIELNTQDQLYEHGETTKGEVIGTYSWWTEEMYGGRGKGKYAGEPYNFKDSGDLFRGFRVEFHDGYLKIFSTDWKADIWEKEIKNRGLSGSLQGLNKQNEMILNYEFIRPELLQDLKLIVFNG